VEKVETRFSVRDGGHYVPGMKYNGVLYISGQLSINPETGQVPEGGVKAEARQALKNLDLVLKEAKLTRNDVLQCRVYIPDVAYWPDLNQVYAEFFGEHKPARIVVPTNKLYNGCLVEIEAVAACGKD
jgi:2-iminobutanoate/2-iminopropanoate deaminase